MVLLPAVQDWSHPDNRWSQPAAAQAEAARVKRGRRETRTRDLSSCHGPAYRASLTGVASYPPAQTLAAPGCEPRPRNYAAPSRAVWGTR
jgi:hypothetical protein